MTDDPTATDAELEIGRGILAQLGHKPAPPPAPEAPRLTPGRLREALGGGIDYAQIHADRAKVEDQIRKDALKIARRYTPEEGAEFASHYGVHITADELKSMTDQEEASA